MRPLRPPGRLVPVMLALVAILLPAAASAPLSPSLGSPPGDLVVGDRVHLAGAVTNTGPAAIEHAAVYFMLLRVEPGDQQTMSLEDWSGDNAIAIGRLEPGQTATHDWPLRLIQGGHYAAVLTVVVPGDPQPVVSRLAEFTVREKPLISSARVLPVAVGEPLVVAAALAALGWRGLRRGRRGTDGEE
jgi:hypothetical protein